MQWFEPKCANRARYFAVQQFRLVATQVFVAAAGCKRRRHRHVVDAEYFAIELEPDHRFSSRIAQILEHDRSSSSVVVVDAPTDRGLDRQGFAQLFSAVRSP